MTSLIKDFGRKRAAQHIYDGRFWGHRICQDVRSKSGTTFYTAESDNLFWDNFTYTQSAYAEISADNTWTQIVATGGSGTIGNIIGPAAELGAWDCTTDIELVLDYNTYQWTCTVPNAETNRYRILLGPHFFSAGGTTIDDNRPGSYSDPGFGNAAATYNMIDGFLAMPGTLNITSAKELRAHRLPTLRFLYYMQVRIRTNHRSTGTARRNRGAVTYQYDWTGAY